MGHSAPKTEFKTGLAKGEGQKRDKARHVLDIFATARAERLCCFCNGYRCSCCLLNHLTDIFRSAFTPKFVFGSNFSWSSFLPIPNNKSSLVLSLTLSVCVCVFGRSTNCFEMLLHRWRSSYLQFHIVAIALHSILFLIVVAPASPPLFHPLTHTPTQTGAQCDNAYSR